MAIVQKTLNIFDADVDAIVIPVNTDGAMGKGLALQFKWRYDELFTRYRTLCKQGRFNVTQLLPMRLAEGKYALLFPTKEKWWDPSKLEWVQANTAKLAEWCRQKEIKSMAIPPVGCGEGGLDFDVVRDLLFEAFDDHPTDVVFTVSAGNYRRVLN